MPPPTAPDPVSAPQADIDVQLLEPLLRQLVDLIGLGPTMRLVEAYGGTRLCVPEKIENNQDLLALLGSETCRLLSRHYRLERLVIPKAEAALRAIRNRRILADLERMSVRQVALKYQLHERRIWQIQAECGEPESSPNGNLFD